MVTAHIQDEVISGPKYFQVSDIPDPEVDIYLCLAGFAFSYPNRFGDIVDPGSLPAVLGEGDHVGGCAAPKVERPARGMVLDEFDQLWGGDPAFPGWVAEIHEPEEEFAEVFFEHGCFVCVRVCELYMEKRWSERVIEIGRAEKV